MLRPRRKASKRSSESAQPIQFFPCRPYRARGMSPDVPHCTVGCIEPSAERMYQVPSDGLQTTLSARASVAMLDGSGTSPAVPHCTEGCSTSVALDLTYQVPLDGRKI